MFCGFANKNKFKIYVVKLPATHCSCYEFEILWEKIFAVMHRPTKILGYHIKKFGPVMDIGLKSVNDTCL